MPTPTFKGKASTWKQQRGTAFGTSKEGMDHIELKYRGPSSSSSSFFQKWVKGKPCPESGFGHCLLVHSPSIKEDAYGFSTASLRFEGLEQKTVDGKVGEKELSFITYSFNAGWLSFRIDKFPNNEKEMPTWYSYVGESLTARYTSKDRPTANNLKGGTKSELLTKPEPLKKDSGEGPKADQLTLKVDYNWVVPNGAFTYEETAGVFDVTEIWEVFLESVN
tara:strand:- start:1149 stop:1811 length:663 start_codon:yes stop_codon:yes gene_type:complete